MFRLYSKGCEYALRALMQCASEEGAMHGFKDLCQKAHTPEHFTRKMFQKLTKKGWLRSIPGPHGGFRLKISPEKLNLKQLIEAVDGSDAFEGCVLGLSSCQSSDPCALHNAWIAAKLPLMAQLEKKTLADLMKLGDMDRLLRRQRSR